MKKKNYMTGAVFFFAITVIAFIGVVGFDLLGISYAGPNLEERFPDSITLNRDATWGGYSTTDRLELIDYWSAYDDYTVIDGHRYDLYPLGSKVGIPTSTLQQDIGFLNELPSELKRALLSIIQNGYPNNPSFMPGFSWQEKKYITNYMLSHFYNFFEQWMNDTYYPMILQELNTVEKYGPFLVELCEKAKQASMEDEPVFGIGIDQSGISYHLTEDGKYLETNAISVMGSSKDFKHYQVNLASDSNGATVACENGKFEEIAFCSSSEKFVIRYPIEKIKDHKQIQLNPEIIGTFEKYNLSIYYGMPDHSMSPTSMNATSRSAVPAFYILSVPQKIVQSVPFHLNQEVSLGTVDVSVVDIQNNKKLKGATLVVRDSNGNEVAKWNTTEDSHQLKLPVTKENEHYVLTQTVAPNGYELNSESIEFEVKDEGSITRVVMKNTPLIKVPDTSLNIPFIIWIIGGGVLACGFYVIYLGSRKKSRYKK